MKTKHLSNILPVFVARFMANWDSAKPSCRLCRIKTPRRLFLIPSNIDAAFAEAKCTNLGRCFSHFDASPARLQGFDAGGKEQQQIIRLAQEQFVAVRQVEMKGRLVAIRIRLRPERAAMFVNADGSVYVMEPNPLQAPTPTTPSHLKKTIRAYSLFTNYRITKTGSQENWTSSSRTRRWRCPA